MLNWPYIILLGILIAIVASVLFYSLYLYAFFTVLRPYPSFFPVRVDIYEDRFFFWPYLTGDESSLKVAIQNQLKVPYNGTLTFSVTEFPTSKEITSYKLDIQLTPSKALKHGFMTPRLVPGQYVAAAQVQALDRVEILEDGTPNYIIFNSETTSYSFQVLTEQELLNRIIAFSTLGGVTVTALAILFQIRIAKKRIDNEKKSRWKDWYKVHSQQLGQELSEHWKSSSGIFASHIIENYKLVSLEPKEPDFRYSQEAKSHLIRGYASVWERYESAKSNSIEIKKKMDEVVSQFQAKVIELVKAVISDLPQEARWNDNERRFYDIEGTTATMIIAIMISRTNKVPPSKSGTGKRNIGDGELLTELYLLGHHVAIGSEEEMEKLRQALDQWILHEQINQLATDYFNEEKNLAENKNITTYQKELEGHLDNIDAGVPIKGKRACPICDEMYKQIFFEPE